MWNFLKPKKKLGSEYVVIVSGLPRSGTSMMMKMLEAGGLEIMTDYIRSADENNPKGYYEYERVKKLPDGDKEWLAQAQGKVVKVISYLLEHLPAEHSYKIVFMRRAIEEVLSSQRRMLERDGKPEDGIGDDKMAELYERHLQHTEPWLDRQPNMEILYISYNEMLADPQGGVEQVNEFLGGRLDAQAMLQVVDPDLYRERKK